MLYEFIKVRFGARAAPIWTSMRNHFEETCNAESAKRAKLAAAAQQAKAGQDQAERVGQVHVKAEESSGSSASAVPVQPGMPLSQPSTTTAVVAGDDDGSGNSSGGHGQPVQAHARPLALLAPFAAGLPVTGDAAAAAALSPVGPPKLTLSLSKTTMRGVQSQVRSNADVACHACLACLCGTVSFPSSIPLFVHTHVHIQTCSQTWPA